MHQVTSVCRMILLYEARVMNNLMGDCRLVGSTAVPDLRENISGLLPGPPHVRGPNVTSDKSCLVLYQHNWYQ